VGRMRAEGATIGTEGDNDVKVLGAWGYQSGHRYYALVEADDYNSVVLLFIGSLIIQWIDVERRRRDTSGERHDCEKKGCWRLGEVDRSFIKCLIGQCHPKAQPRGLLLPLPAGHKS